MRIRYERKRDLPHCGSPRRRTILVIDLAIVNINFISYAGGNPTQIFQYSHVIDLLSVHLLDWRSIITRQCFLYMWSFSDKWFD